MVPNEEEKVWFYIKDRQQLGPAGVFELKKLFEQGVLNENTYLWTKSAKCWQMAKTLEPFKNFKARYPLQNSSHDNSHLQSNLEEVTFPQGRPLVRFIARMFDLSVFTLFFITLVSIFSPELILKTSKLELFSINVILWLFFEPAVMTIFGNTLGKSLLNTKIKNVNGDYIHFMTAFKRSVYVIAAGMGFGVPVLNFICYLFSYKDLREHGISIWDLKSDTVVLYGSVNTSRVLLMACFPLVLLIAGVMM